MCDHLKIFRFWVYIVEKHEQSEKDDTSQEEWVKVHDLTMTALRVSEKENVYSDIKSITNI